MFQESGVYGTLHYIEEFNLSMIPFDSDLMSMEMEGAFKVSHRSQIRPMKLMFWISGENFKKNKAIGRYFILIATFAKGNHNFHIVS